MIVIVDDIRERVKALETSVSVQEAQQEKISYSQKTGLTSRLWCVELCTMSDLAKAKTYDGSTPCPDVRHELFVSNILQCMTDGDAYTAAGFKSKYPGVGACLLRKKPHIIARLAYRRSELSAKLQVTEERVLAELAKVAFSNMQDFVGTDGDGQFVFRGWDGLSRDQLAAVEAVTVTQETRVNKKGTETQSKQTRFSLHRKLDALEQLAKHLGLFEKDNDQRREITPLVAVIGGTFHAKTGNPDNPA